jgi:hypothetical protein
MTNDPDRLLVLSDLTQKDRIQILLSEYATLRAELITRTGYGFQIAAVALGAGVSGVSWIILQGVSKVPFWAWLLVVAVVVCIGLAIFVNGRDLTRAAKRVAEIEQEVNSRAGEHLLIWETLGGVIGQMGLAKSFITMVKTSSRSKLPLLDPTYLEREAAIAKRKKMASLDLQ